MRLEFRSEMFIFKLFLKVNIFGNLGNLATWLANMEHSNPDSPQATGSRQNRTLIAKN